jgi:hypothetical protein
MFLDDGSLSQTYLFSVFMKSFVMVLKISISQYTMDLHVRRLNEFYNRRKLGLESSGIRDRRRYEYTILFDTFVVSVALT